MSTEDYKKIFSENLTYYLKLNEKTQADLYRYMNVSSATVSDWCNGKKLPRMDKIQSICNWLGLEKSDLLTPKSPEHSNEYLRVTDLSNMYYNSIMHWSEELGLSEHQTCILRAHFSDLLLQYKNLIEKFSYVNINWKQEGDLFIQFYKNRDQNQTLSEIKELYLRQELKKELKNLEDWIKAFPNWISRNEKEPIESVSFLNAAHEINPTEEQKKNADNIMTNDSEWE